MPAALLINDKNVDRVGDILRAFIPMILLWLLYLNSKFGIGDRHASTLEYWTGVLFINLYYCKRVKFIARGVPVLTDWVPTHIL